METNDVYGKLTTGPFPELSGLSYSLVMLIDDWNSEIILAKLAVTLAAQQPLNQYQHK